MSRISTKRTETLWSLSFRLISSSTAILKAFTVTGEWKRVREQKGSWTPDSTKRTAHEGVDLRHIVEHLEERRKAIRECDDACLHSLYEFSW